MAVKLWQEQVKYTERCGLHRACLLRSKSVWTGLEIISSVTQTSRVSVCCPGLLRMLSVKECPEVGYTCWPRSKSHWSPVLYYYIFATLMCFDFTMGKLGVGHWCSNSPPGPNSSSQSNLCVSAFVYSSDISSLQSFSTMSECWWVKNAVTPSKRWMFAFSVATKECCQTLVSWQKAQLFNACLPLVWDVAEGRKLSDKWWVFIRQNKWRWTQ